MRTSEILRIKLTELANEVEVLAKYGGDSEVKKGYEEIASLLGSARGKAEKLEKKAGE